MASTKVAAAPVAAGIAQILNSSEVSELIDEIESSRGRGRKGFGTRALLGACIVRSLYAIPTWSRTVALIGDHPGLRDALGDAPSQWACYRFSEKLSKDRSALTRCLDRVIEALRERMPEYGQNVAIDASDLPAWANGQRFLYKDGPERQTYSDPDASWGHRSAVSTRAAGSFYGYKIHQAVCTATGLPMAWKIETAKNQEMTVALPILDAVIERGFHPETCAMDKGYDSNAIHDAVENVGCRPIISQRKHPNSKSHNDIPVCDHGTWVFAGTDFEGKQTEWRCPTGVCTESKWLTASRRNPLIPRHTDRFKALYRGRSAVEREFGRLKHHYGLVIRVRGMRKVSLHADLVMLARLSHALMRS